MNIGVYAVALFLFVFCLFFVNMYITIFCLTFRMEWFDSDGAMLPHIGLHWKDPWPSLDYSTEKKP